MDTERTLIGHEFPYSYMNSVLSRGTQAHSYIFYGPAHVGKYTFALRVAQYFFCENVFDTRTLENVCDVCSVCKKISSGIYPNVRILGGDTGDERRQSIVIDDIRELKKFFSFASNGMQVAIIDNADNMTREASDALLKVFEEPTNNGMFFLITEHIEALSDTIRSRAAKLRFSTASRAQMEVAAVRVIRDNSLRTQSLMLSDGRIGTLYALAGKESRAKEKVKNMREVVEIISSKNIAGACALSMIASENDIMRADMVEHAFRAVREKMHSATEIVELSAVIRSLKKMDLRASLFSRAGINRRIVCDAFLFAACGVHPVK